MLQESIQDAIDAANNSKTMYTYITDTNTDENLWGRLPPYFDSLASNSAFNCKEIVTTTGETFMYKIAWCIYNNLQLIIDI